MKSSVFLDSSYAIALSSSSDQHHKQALRLAEQIEAESTSVITTHAVVVEIGNALARQRYRQAAVSLISALRSDPTVNIVPISEPLVERAFRLFSNRPDKNWGLTDCISFIVMEEFSIATALTADAHFRQAGFSALLLDSELP